MKLPTITEVQFTRQVIAYARLMGWRAMHQRPGMTRRGKWVTATQGDGVGWPDLFLVRGNVALAPELKVGRNQPTAEQLAWMDALSRAGIYSVVWRPENWDEIEAILRGEA